MKHALAKVNISIDNSWGPIGTVIVSAYKEAGHFTNTDVNGIPEWEIKDKDKTIDAVFGFYDLIKDGILPLLPYLSCRVILRDSRCLMFLLILMRMVIRLLLLMKFLKNTGKTFEAGKAYKLTIRRAQKNTNSRSIAMSVRCVSE